MKKILAQVALCSLALVGTAVGSPRGGTPRSLDAKANASAKRGPGTKRAAWPAHGALGGSRRTAKAGFSRRVVAPSAHAFVKNDGTFDQTKLDALGEMFQSYVAPYERIENLQSNHTDLSIRLSILERRGSSAAAPRVAALRAKLTMLKTLGKATRPALDEARAYIKGERETRPLQDQELTAPVAKVASAIAEGELTPADRIILRGRLNGLGAKKLGRGLKLFADMAARQAGALADIRARHAATIGPAEAMLQEIIDEITALETP